MMTRKLAHVCLCDFRLQNPLALLKDPREVQEEEDGVQEEREGSGE